MIKKLNLIFSPVIRERMQERNIQSMPGFQSVMNFISGILAVIAEFKIPEIKECKSFASGDEFAWKLFDYYHTEGKWLRNALHSSERAEAVFLPSYLDRLLKLELNFYGKNQKVVKLKIIVEFNIQTGSIVNQTMVISPNLRP